jgi:tetracycline 7-halogenase / FADH2 O2-dependent halogenase
MTSAALHVDADVAVVGAGFAGALAALALGRIGRTVALVERGRHPRFAIGESSTPLANLLVEELADRYDLPRVRPLSKWGTWQRAQPGIACGLKRGFTFFRHRPGSVFTDDDRHANQLLVAASPHDDIADTHWYRPDFDHFLVREAEREGAAYLDQTGIDRVDLSAAGAVLEGRRLERPVRVTARFVIDASGPRGFLHRALGLQEAPLQWLPATQALYTHFTGVVRWDRLVPAGGHPPFPVDDAAVHHVFPGGWIWVLRFNNGITSAGAAVTDGVARSLRVSDGAAAWERLIATLPSVRAQFEPARATLPFVHAPRLAFRCGKLSGQGWAMLPSAAGVIDPLLSTGFPLTLLGLARLLEVIERTWGRPERDEAIAACVRQSETELDATERLVAALYAAMGDFALFKRLALLYFAAASFSETVRRLGHPERARGFLLCDDPVFGTELRACSEAALGSPVGGDRESLLSRIDRAIVPVDVAGLLDRGRLDWHPVLVEDLFAAKEKLGASDEALRRLAERCGLEIRSHQ